MTATLISPPSEMEDDYRMYLQQLKAGSRGDDRDDYQRQIEVLDRDGLADAVEYCCFLESKEEE